VVSTDDDSESTPTISDILAEAISFLSESAVPGMLDSRVIAPCPLERGATWVEVPFHNNIIGNFMVYQDQFETNLLQLSAHPETSERFFIIFVIIFEVNIVAEQKQVGLYLETIFLFFISSHFP